MLSITSLNCNSLRSINKFKNIYNSMKSEILRLQETHFTADSIKNISGQVSGKVFFSNGPSGMQGVATIVSKRFQNNVISSTSDSLGRLLKLSICIDDEFF